MEPENLQNNIPEVESENQFDKKTVLSWILVLVALVIFTGLYLFVFNSPTELEEKIYTVEELELITKEFSDSIEYRKIPKEEKENILENLSDRINGVEVIKVYPATTTDEI